MPTKSGDRSEYFPAIEKKYGQKISHWISELKELEGAKYPEQVGFLKENHGFSQAHANALVMYFRGSKSSKRFDKPKDFFNTLDPIAAKTCKKIFKEIQEKFPKLELVIAWNQPMLRIDKNYIFGLSVSKRHILIAPWSTRVLKSFADQLVEFSVNKKTFAVPLDWKVDGVLLRKMVKARLSEL